MAGQAFSAKHEMTRLGNMALKQSVHSRAQCAVARLAETRSRHQRRQHPLLKPPALLNIILRLRSLADACSACQTDDIRPVVLFYRMDFLDIFPGFKVRFFVDVRPKD
jgi:hypothetical protein